MTPLRPTDFQKATDRGVVSISGSRAAYFGPALALAPHRNAAATLVIGLDAAFQWRNAVRGPSDAAFHHARTLWIAPGTFHQVRGGRRMAFVYFDPLSDEVEGLRGRASTLVHSGQRLDTSSVDALCEQLGLPRRHLSDVRIAKAAREIAARPADFETIGAASALVGLSASRFRTLFNRELGVPFRRYRLWARMTRVMMAVRDGATLTAAAHRTGFASSAHFSTAFREMFGLVPSRLLRSGVEIRVEPGPAGRQRGRPGK